MFPTADQERSGQVPAGAEKVQGDLLPKVFGPKRVEPTTPTSCPLVLHSLLGNEYQVKAAALGTQWWV